jgi:hypothetical protein
MIPKIIHYVWVGGPLPSLQREYIDGWRRMNPDYEFVLWNEDNIDFSLDVLNRAYRERKWAKVADIVRLMAIRQRGGIYLDTDIQLYKPLDSLLACSCVFGFQSRQDTPDWVANGMMAAEPGHWFIKRALEELIALRPMPFGLDRPTRYGPKLITRLLREEGLRRYAAEGVWVKDIFVCPTQYFFPFAFGEEFTPACITTETLGVHFWEKSWEKDVPGWLRVAKSVRDRARRLSNLAT